MKGQSNAEMVVTVSLLDKPWRQMTLEELQEWEEEELNVGPFSVLTKLVKNSTKGLINRRNNRTLLGWVRAFNTCGRI